MQVKPVVEMSAPDDRVRLFRIIPKCGVVVTRKIRGSVKTTRKKRDKKQNNTICSNECGKSVSGNENVEKGNWLDEGLSDGSMRMDGQIRAYASYFFRTYFSCWV